MFKKPADSWFDKGNKLLKKQKLEEALECFKKAYELGTELNLRAGALFNTGVCYHKQSKYEDAIAYYDQAIALVKTEKGVVKDPLLEPKVAQARIDYAMHCALIQQ